MTARHILTALAYIVFFLCVLSIPARLVYVWYRKKKGC